MVIFSSLPTSNARDMFNATSRADDRWPWCLRPWLRVAKVGRVGPELVDELIAVTEQWARVSVPGSSVSALAFPGLWVYRPTPWRFIRRQLALVTEQPERAHQHMRSMPPAA